MFAKLIPVMTVHRIVFAVIPRNNLVNKFSHTNASKSKTTKGIWVFGVDLLFMAAFSYNGRFRGGGGGGGGIDSVVAISNNLYDEYVL